MSERPQPLVTVIIPCYNHERYIEQSVLSVVRQTYANIELLTFDDGSRDGSAAILAGLAKTHGFYFEAQTNMGLSATLNKAIAMGKGKYICPASSDDIFMPDKIEKQVTFMEQRPDVAVCGGNVLAIDADGDLLPKQRQGAYREFSFEDIFRSNNRSIVAPTAMIRKAVLDEVGGYDPAIRLEDMYMWLKITSAGHKLAKLEDELLYYRKHGANTYRNYAWMTENVLRTYAEYRNHPDYQLAVQKYLAGTFVAAAKRDKPYARALLKQIKPRYFPLKIARGLLFLLKP